MDLQNFIELNKPYFLDIINKVTAKYPGAFSDRDDLLQECYTIASIYANKYDEQTGTKFSTYIYKPVYYGLVNYIREDSNIPVKDYDYFADGKAFVPTTFVIDDEDGGIDLFSEVSDDPLDVFVCKERNDRIYSSIKTLPSELQQVLTMYVLEDYSFQDIANVQGISKEAVRKRYNKAVKILNERLKNLKGEE